jgi:nucleotide-binding universal stress UspA family protein
MFKKILVPLDGSQIAAAVLPKVVKLAATMKAKVTLLQVCYSDSGEQIGETTPGVLQAVVAQETRVSERFLAQICQDLEAQGLQADWPWAPTAREKWPGTWVGWPREWRPMPPCRYSCSAPSN